MKYVLVFIGIVSFVVTLCLAAAGTLGMCEVLVNKLALAGTPGHAAAVILITLWGFCVALLTIFLLSLGRQVEEVWRWR